VCFLKNKLNEIPYPVFKTENEDGSPCQVILQKIEKGQPVFTWKESSIEDVYEWLMDMDMVFPDIPSYELLSTYLGKICPESMADSEASQYYRMESAVQAYGLDALELPFKLFDLFECVRSTENLYEILDNMKREKSAEMANKKR
jgi:hypothetical protein